MLRAAGPTCGPDLARIVLLGPFRGRRRVEALPGGMMADTGIDLVPDQLALARAQMDAAQYVVVEGTLRRRIATARGHRTQPRGARRRPRSSGRGTWRSGRPVAAYEAVAAVRRRAWSAGGRSR